MFVAAEFLSRQYCHFSSYFCCWIVYIFGYPLTAVHMFYMVLFCLYLFFSIFQMSVLRFSPFQYCRVSLITTNTFVPRMFILSHLLKCSNFYVVLSPEMCMADFLGLAALSFSLFSLGCCLLTCVSFYWPGWNEFFSCFTVNIIEFLYERVFQLCLCSGSLHWYTFTFLSYLEYFIVSPIYVVLFIMAKLSTMFLSSFIFFIHNV